MRGFSLIFAFAAGLAPAGGWAGPDLSEAQTEAGFAFECPGSGQCAGQAADSLKLTECFSRLLSKECRDVPKKHRMTCGRDGSLADYAQGAGQSVFSCGEYLLSSAEFLFELARGALQFSAAVAFDSEARGEAANYLSSAKNYLSIEFYRAWKEAEGTKAERLLKAAASLAGDSFSAMFSWLRQFVSEQHASFMCYSGSAQTAILCSVLAGLAIPVPGSSMFSSIAAGLKAGKLSSKTAKLLKKTVDNSMGAFRSGGGARFKGKALSGKGLKAASSRIYADMSQRLIQASKNMPKSVQKEVSELFSKANAKAIQLRLEGAARAAAKGSSLSSAAFLAAAAGALTSYRIYLSKDTAEFVTKEISDQMSTAYVGSLLEESGEGGAGGSGGEGGPELPSAMP